MKFCFNCKHWIDNKDGAEFSKCRRAIKDEEANRLYCVTGNIKMADHFYATTERGSNGGCGPEGKHWEAKNENS